MLLCSVSGGCQEVEKIQGKLGDNPLEKVRLFSTSFGLPDLLYPRNLAAIFLCINGAA
jgi:hypothetical protein